MHNHLRLKLESETKLEYDRKKMIFPLKLEIGFEHSIGTRSEYIVPILLLIPIPSMP
jgi:hypothetical protein